MGLIIFFLSHYTFLLISFSFSLFSAVLGLPCCASFSLVVMNGDYPSWQCTGFPLWWLFFLWSEGSRAHRLQHLWHKGSVIAAPRL